MVLQKLFEEKLKVTLGAPPQPPSPVLEASETAELNSADTSSAAYKLGGAATGAISRDMPVSLDDYKTECRKLREKLALAELRSTEMSAQVCAVCHLSWNQVGTACIRGRLGSSSLIPIRLGVAEWQALQ